MASYPTGQIALANANNQTFTQGFRPRLIEFYGYEGEDFRHFQEILDSYLAITNTLSDDRKLIVLKSQLRRAANIYFEKEILKRIPNVTYDNAMELFKQYYIPPELIQSYELEFNEMFQGEQEHPQIFLARLRGAADLANITSEAVVESRFRAGLLKEIKQFCIQSSVHTFQEWINYADGWWNDNRPRKIAMVDNPFIRRNVNNALIYHDDNRHTRHHGVNNHNLELIDTEESHIHAVPINDLRNNARNNYIAPYSELITSPNQLVTMEVKGNANNSHLYTQPMMNRHNNQLVHTNSQHDLVNLIQETIRNELNLHQHSSQPTRSHNRRPRNDNYNNSQNNDYNDRYNRNEINGYTYRGNNRYRNNYDHSYGRYGYSNQNPSLSKPTIKKLNGSVAFDNQKNGQSNTHHNNKPIKQQNQQHNLNVILTQNEYDNPYQAQDLYTAIRPEHPPEVLSSKPYSKPITREKGKQPSSASVTKRVNERNQVKETSNVPKQPIQATGNMEVDSDLPIEIKPKPIRRKTKAPPIRYDIVSDVMNQKADISVADLIVAAPTLRRSLANACKPKRIPVTETSKETMAIIEEDDINNTAVYSKINIGDKTVKVLVDCGAAKTCMSKSLADALGLEIDAASESVFTLGNGTKQPALGVIYDVPIEVQDDLIIPCTVELYTKLPTSISSTNSKETKKAHFEDDKTDSEEDEVDEESEESTDEESTEEESEDEEHSLLLLENNYKEDIQIKSFKD
ncbi:hypothetical protein G6F37_011876 [Rhizopus arrhizus]|nr:hypothetical protein G6F37_011876 [Rhizopus arrhizus]